MKWKWGCATATSLKARESAEHLASSMKKNCIAAIYIEPKAVLFFLPFFFLPNTHRLPTVDLNFENCVILASKQKPLEFLVCQGGHLKRNSFTRGFVFFGLFTVFMFSWTCFISYWIEYSRLFFDFGRLNFQKPL